MLTYNPENAGKMYIYEYLYESIKNDILSGNLKANEKLPSKRAFAKQSGVSVISIENAYEQLLSEGFIYSCPRKGYYVTDISQFADLIRGSDEAGNDSAFENAEIPKSDKRADVDNNHIVADFTSNQTSSENFPFSIWAKLMREVLSGSQRELMTNSPSGGVTELRHAIAKHIKEFKGVSVSPNQIIVGAGTEYLYGILIQFFGRDKTYALENPGYDKVKNIYESYDVEYREIGIDEQGLNIDELTESGVQIVHATPSHHFPTGITMPVNRRYELLKWAKEDETRFIIEDDYDSEFRLSGRPIPTLMGMDVNAKVIYMNTFTKSLASTIRISYMVLPEKLLGDFYERLGFYSSTVSTFDQYVLAKFINEGYFEKHINRMRNFYRKKRDFLLKEIEKSSLKESLKIFEENSGLHFIVYLEIGDEDDAEFVQRLGKKGVLIRNLENNRHMFLINYSNVENDDITKALKIMGDTISGE